MRLLYKNSKLKFYIGDVRNFESVNEAMVGVDYIFHSAALKQVPSCEIFPNGGSSNEYFRNRKCYKCSYSKIKLREPYY